MDCVFCKIVNNEIPSYTIYEDDIVKVFLNINPISNGHTLIIPKKHYNDLVDIDNDTLAYINKITKEIYHLLDNKLHFDGLKIVQNNGCFQEIKHYHIHLIPHYKEDKIISIEDIYKLLTKEK